jgi:hypothetical protein
MSWTMMEGTRCIDSLDVELACTVFFKIIWSNILDLDDVVLLLQPECFTTRSIISNSL